MGWVEWRWNGMGLTDLFSVKDRCLSSNLRKFDPTYGRCRNMDISLSGRTVRDVRQEYNTSRLDRICVYFTEIIIIIPPS